MTITSDFIVIGAGIAGASAAAKLAESASVTVLEMESQPGYHSTGRSAALFSETYGPPQIRALSRASRPHYEAGWPDQPPLLTPRGVLFVAREDQMDELRTMASHEPQALVQIDARETMARVPVLRPDYVAGALLEDGAMEIDVAALHAGYLSDLRKAGGRVETGAEAVSATRRDGVWRVETARGTFEARVLVNAAGAWADVFAAKAGVAPLGLQPKRRSIVVFDGPAGIDASEWPMVIDASEEFYFKPDAGRFLGSPADQTPVDPQDIQPEEIDIATAIWRIEQATTLEIRTVGRKWAGLRSFLPDGTPAIGFDREAEGFFWLAGQGGYGIQSAPAAGRVAASLARGEGIPASVVAEGVVAEALSPGRFRE